MQENLFVCVPKDHELATHKSLTFADINGFNFLLRTEFGFWDTLCREKNAEAHITFYLAKR